MKIRAFRKSVNGVGGFAVCTLQICGKVPLRGRKKLFGGELEAVSLLSRFGSKSSPGSFIFLALLLILLHTTFPNRNSKLHPPSFKAALVKTQMRRRGIYSHRILAKENIKGVHSLSETTNFRIKREEVNVPSSRGNLNS